MEGDGTQRIFDLVGNGGQEGRLGIVKGAQPQVLFLQKELLLVIFLQMKITSSFQLPCKLSLICSPINW